MGSGNYQRIYGFCEGEISAIHECLANGIALDRTKTAAYAERMGVAGQVIELASFTAGGLPWRLDPKYWPKTSLVAINSWNPHSGENIPAYNAAYLVNAVTENYESDVVEIVMDGAKVQKYLANGTADGAPVFSRNPIWCMLDYMMVRAQEPYLASEIDWSAAYTSATLCDTLGYQLNLVLSEQKNDDAILTLMRNSCRAFFTFPSGKVAINIEHVWSGAAAHSFDDLSAGKTQGNVEPGSIKPYKRSKDNVYNRVIVKYRDEEERDILAILDGDLAAAATTITYKARQGTLAATGTIYLGGQAITYTGSTHNVDLTGELTGCSARANDFEYGYPLFQGTQTFPERTAIWYDEPHQRKIHQVNQLDIDGSCIGTYRQAFAIAAFHGKKSIYGNQNVRFRGFRPSLVCTVGDQILLTFAKRGWVDWKFRIIGMSEGNNNKIDVDCELYEDSFYPELMGTASAPNTTTLPSPFEAPAHVTGVTLTEGGLLGTDGTYVPGLTLTYDLPTDQRFWSYALVQVKVNAGAYLTFGEDRSRGIGFSIDAVNAGYTKGDTVVVKVISINDRNIPADADTAPTASTAIAASIVTLDTPTNLVLEGGG
ncbi:MAG TPA: hypothetical protein DCS05_04200, partial [Nitrospiraceae bacterium]|nr:hypothetical protein [Nitrospiraceae bacterium]